ncbi:metal-sulfur cluster biosynthetic enzyme [Mesorhizobium sp. YL-MeA3-2017]|jgi:metal-sulfur cluster biosynthetic enzyme|nr:NifU N-terminal domain-containing protein [Mesorhizobium sp. YL-MeA3-2017]MDQ0333498.1 metal-sulfur cluster biosynthetic enzyme [Mesorhizobium sp. YL-MeA3-2017]
MFIQTEATADPASLKFLPGRQVMAQGTLQISDRKAAARSPLAVRLFDVDGVTALSFAADSITITKRGGDWQHLKPALLGVIMEHFMSGAPVVLEPLRNTGEVGSTEEQVIVAAVKEALRLVIDPELGYNIVDLGLVYDVAIENGAIANITMTTTTRGCPATNYLKDGARDAAWAVNGIEFVEVKLTYEPPWTPEMMSIEAKRHLGISDGGGW